MKRRLFADKSLNIPSFIFRDRTFSVMESLVAFLKEERGLTFAQIAELLNRDDRTVWTVYHRMKKKREEVERDAEA
ncbi:hypothetical protein D6783_01660 [Candidatus Woesearchaeota archaeon]|nr:MAG: hypothetical protein D6783_01660 [Candidatus Woesearchaeota archaeon]